MLRLHAFGFVPCRYYEKMSSLSVLGIWFFFLMKFFIKEKIDIFLNFGCDY